jgi:hypothetical protein
MGAGYQGHLFRAIWTDGAFGMAIADSRYGKDRRVEFNREAKERG